MSWLLKGHPMSNIDHFMSSLGPRSAFYLRSSLPGSRAKRLANLLGCSGKQANRLLGGARPTTEQLLKLAQEFGWGFVNFVFEPAVGTPAMYAEMEAMEERLAQMIKTREEEDARGFIALTREGLDGAGVGGEQVGNGPCPGEFDAAAARAVSGGPGGGGGP